jgi:methylglyoxal synthase
MLAIKGSQSHNTIGGAPVPENNQKPIIGMLASHDSPGRNKRLKHVLDFLVQHHAEDLQNFQFVITGGTYRRVIEGEVEKITAQYKKISGVGVEPDTRKFLLEKCGVLRMPTRRHGGVVLLTDLVVKRKISIVWPFLTPTTPHWLSPENLALLRLCDHCHANRLMNAHSVIEWAGTELKANSQRNPQPCPPQFCAGGKNSDEDEEMPVTLREDQSHAIDWNFVERRKRESKLGHTLALIAHDEMKSRIEDFAIDYQNELAKFGRIITTGTTGKVVQDVVPQLAEKVRRYNSGPKGGDIEIAAEMIFQRCDVAVFLVDPLSAHPHTEDIKVLFGAAIVNGVRLLTNERQARDWMDRTGGNVDECKQYNDWVKRTELANAAGTS